MAVIRATTIIIYNVIYIVVCATTMSYVTVLLLFLGLILVWNMSEELEILFEDLEGSLYCTRRGRGEACFLRLNEKLIPKSVLREIEEEAKETGFVKVFEDVRNNTAYYSVSIISPHGKQKVKELARFLKRILEGL